MINLSFPSQSRTVGLLQAALATVLLCLEAAFAEASAIQGVVRYEGAVPPRTVPDNAGRRPPLLQVDPDTGGLAGAAVYLEAIAGKLPTETCVPCEPVEIGQENEEFVPRVVALREGQVLRIGNNDAGANHNVRSVPGLPDNRFSVMTPYGQHLERQFKPEPGGAPIRLACDYHAWMTAWVYVFEHPWFAVTDEAGRFALPAPPPGQYRVVVVQPDGKLRAEGVIQRGSAPVSTVNVRFDAAHLGGKDRPEVAATPAQ